MNIFILSDLEGIHGVTSIEQMDRTSHGYRLAQASLAESVNIAADTCFKCGADMVFVLDSHGGGGNIVDKSLDKRITQVNVPQWQELLVNGKIDFQIELGCHARAGTIGGFLDHTINSKQWFSYRVNGIEYGELGIHGIVCGAYNVPIIACSGDETACTQAKEYIPDIYAAVVKHAFCRNSAVAFENAASILKTTIETAIKNRYNIKPLKVEFPLTIELTYYRTDMCEQALENCPVNVTRVDARTLKKTVNKVINYYDLKF